MGNSSSNILTRCVYFTHDMIKQNKDKFEKLGENMDYLNEEFKLKHLSMDFNILIDHVCKNGWSSIIESPQIIVCPSKQQFGFFTKWLDTDYYTLCPNIESKIKDDWYWCADFITELSWKAGEINVIPVISEFKNDKYSYEEYPDCVPKADSNGRINFCSRENPIFISAILKGPLLFRFEGEGEIQLKLAVGNLRCFRKKIKNIETKITDRHWLCISHDHSASIKVEPENRCLRCGKFCKDNSVCGDIDLMPVITWFNLSKVKTVLYDY